MAHLLISPVNLFSINRIFFPEYVTITPFQRLIIVMTLIALHLLNQIHRHHSYSILLIYNLLPIIQLPVIGQVSILQETNFISNSGWTELTIHRLLSLVFKDYNPCPVQIAIKILTSLRRVSILYST